MVAPRFYLYGLTHRDMAKRSTKPPRPNSPQGTRVAGRIVKMLIGQGYGFIRLPNAREVYFHRADLQDGTAFNGLRVGDAVKFELLEDMVSGPRALHVVRHKRKR